MADTILLLRTGGTIEAEAYADPRQPPSIVYIRDNNLIKVAMRTVADDGYEWLEIDNGLIKDSKEYTADDIKKLASAIQQNDSKYFLIIHGTDWMVKNAILLEDALDDELQKVIVFVGSIVPLSMAEQYDSDAYPLLKYAMENIRNLPSGIFVTGYDNENVIRFFDPIRVKKDYKASIENLKFTLMVA